MGSGQWSESSGQKAMGSMVSGQWAVGSNGGQWAASSIQWAVHIWQWAVTVCTGQWTGSGQ